MFGIALEDAPPHQAVTSLENLFVFVAPPLRYRGERGDELVNFFLREAFAPLLLTGWTRW